MRVHGEFTRHSDDWLYALRPHFPYALFYNEELERHVPVLLHQRGEFPDDVYDVSDMKGDVEYYTSERHDGNLSCPGAGCCAELYFNKGKEGRAGNSAFHQSGHWKTKKDSTHRDDCNFKATPREEHVYDDTLGYRVHVNLKPPSEHSKLTGLFKESSSIYYIGHKGRPKLKSEFKSTHKFARLEDMRSFEMHEPNNFLTLIRRGDFTRLSQSAFINHDHILSAEEFIIRQSRNPAEPEYRFFNLFDRLSSMRAGKLLPCLMEFDLDKGTQDKVANSHHSVTSKPIFMKQEKQGYKYTGPKHYIIPRAVPVKGQEQAAISAFAEAGRYLVLGYVSLAEPIQRSGAVLHYMDIKIAEPSQIQQADLGDILQKTLKKHPSSLNLGQTVKPA